MNSLSNYFRVVIALLILLGWGIPGHAPAQDAAGQNRTAALQITMLKTTPTIDGRIDASEWGSAALVDQHFVQFEPEFGVPSPYRTVVRIGQTEAALYVAFEAHDPDMDRLAAAKTQRDSNLGGDDSVAVLLDTFADQRTGYLFRTNVLATQQDIRIADNGRTLDNRWDTEWHSAATRQDDRWTVEVEIPFSSLKFATGTDRTWGINFVRTTPRRLEKSVWSGPGESLLKVSSFGILRDLDVHKQQDPWQFIPYALGAIERGEGTDLEAGVDIRWRPSSQLGVDLTINPDFALVEADVETINLSRFEESIPEKRPFFLEGNEMFSQRIRQFYSRRIGDINAGAKANGKLGRTDFSTIAASEDIEIQGGGNDETANYGAVRLQHGLARGSTVGLLAANRNFQNENTGSVGVDTSLFFSDTLGATAQLLRVHGPTADGGLAWFVRPSWDTATSHFHVRYTNLDVGIQDDFNDVGFVTDDNRKEFDTNARHTFWMSDGPIEKVQPSVNYNRYRGQDGTLRSWNLRAEVDVDFRNGWEFEIRHTDEFKLFEKEFRNDRTTVQLGWDGRDGREVSAFAGSGVNFDADLKLYGAEVDWPVGDSWRLSYEVRRVELRPDLDNDSTTIHVFDVLYAFHANLFAKVFVQTNAAIDKENVQALWVWRFQPPFGSLQLAYQRGTSERGQESQQDDSFFTKVAWVF
jgi:hypothetical protein